MAKQQYVLNDGVWIPTGGAPGAPSTIPGPPGRDGVDGQNGADGAPGVPGPPGGSYLSAQWNFNQNTTVSPASGTMRMDATTYAAVTTLWIHETDRDGLDRSAGLSLALPADQIIMQSAQGRAVWNVVSQADSGAYRTFVVTLAESTGTRPSASSTTTLYIMNNKTGHPIQDEGTTLTYRSKLNFVGAGVTATDDAANDRTNVTVPGGSGGSTILSGTATPTAGTGAVSDYYLDTDDRVLYGPKLASPYLPSKSLFTTETPTGAISSAAGTWSFGMGITCAVSGRVTGVRYYRPATSTSVASTTMTLWSDGGTLLATGTTTVDTVGWITVTFATPVTVTAGQKVWPVLYGSTTVDQQCGKRTSLTPITNGNLSNGAGNGFYKFGAPHGMPTSSENRSYFVDVVFEADGTNWPVALYGAAGQSTILSGTAAPLNADGAVGDYYLDTDDRVLYGPKQPNTLGAEDYVTLPGSSQLSYTYTYGVKHRFSEAGVVPAIRVLLGASATGNDVEVYLYSGAGALLGNKTVSGLTPGQWNRVPFDTPVAVLANTTYVAAVYCDSFLTVSSSPSAGQVSGKVSVLANNVDGVNGTYAANRDTFPSSAIGMTACVAATFAVSPLIWPVALYGSKNIIVLGPVDAVPGGTPTGTIIVRTT